MEARLSIKIAAYLKEFKSDIETKINEGTYGDELIEYIQTYDDFTLSEVDFQKRKRVKNFVPMFDRCCAKRANDERCTRRKKDGCEYCGTHLKGTPHGIIEDNSEPKSTTQKIEVYAQDIQGIIYYIDKNNNVYQAEDIVSNKVNPKIIAKYVKDGENYSIPEFNI